MFRKNETIFYHHSGICKIIDITEKNIANKTKTYYVLQPINNPCSLIYIPSDSEVLVSQMKEILSREEVKNIIQELPYKSSIWIDDRNSRKEKFKDILQNGNCLEIVIMLKSIYLKKIELSEKRKKLPSADDAIYREAEKMLVDTFAYILNMRKEEVIPYIISQSHE